MNRLWYWEWLMLTIVAILLTVISAAKSSSKKLTAGGRIVPEDDGNWQVAIIHQNNLICSGSLLRNNVVLTAAACIRDVELSDVKIRAGSKIFKRGGQVRRIFNAAFHPQYQEHDHANNIALMQMVKPLNAAISNITTVRLPSVIHEDLPSSLYIYGWGTSSLATKRALSKQLRVSKYKVYSDSKCMNYLTESHRKYVENIFCIGDRAKQVDICVDDIGGPAVSQNGVQYGVISHGGVCSNDNTLIMTNVVSHLPWLRGVLKEWTNMNGRSKFS